MTPLFSKKNRIWLPLIRGVMVLFLLDSGRYGEVAGAESKPFVLIVQGEVLQPFIEVKSGFQKTIDAETTDLIVSGMTTDLVTKHLKEADPDMILVIGTEGLLRVKSFTAVPMIYAMVLNPDSILEREAQTLSGIGIHLPFDQQLSIYREMLPGMKRIGVVYSRERSVRLVKTMETIAHAKGIDLVSKEITATREAPSAILELAGKIDAFLMLPDIGVVTPQIVDFLLITSFKNRMPILTFAEKYVKRGALISIEIDPFDIGVQAGEMANRIWKGGKAPMPPENARKASISINKTIADKLGVPISPSLKNKATLYDGWIQNQ